MPSKAEWDVLTTLAGGEKAGKFLKATSGWKSNGDGQDKYGFSAMPGGEGRPDGSFDLVGINGYWWSATEYDANNAYTRGMSSEEYIHTDIFRKSYFLFSVRCLKD